MVLGKTLVNIFCKPIACWAVIFPSCCVNHFNSFIKATNGSSNSVTGDCAPTLAVKPCISPYKLGYWACNLFNTSSAHTPTCLVGTIFNSSRPWYLVASNTFSYLVEITLNISWKFLLNWGTDPSANNWAWDIGTDALILSK